MNKNDVRYVFDREERLIEWKHPKCGASDELDGETRRKELESPEVQECPACGDDLCPQCEVFICETCLAQCCEEHRQEFADLLVCPACLAIAMVHSSALKGCIEGAVYPATRHEAGVISDLFPDEIGEMREAA